MKKFCFFLTVLPLALVLQFCSTAKKTAKAHAKITYISTIQPLVETSCTPCHFPPKGNKKPYNTYASVKDDVDEILTRINKNPTDKGFMPMRHPKLSDSTINLFVQWKNDGLLEK